VQSPKTSRRASGTNLVASVRQDEGNQDPPYLGAFGTPAAHTGVVSELSYPPFTYVLTVGSPSFGQVGCRITHFADLDDAKQEVKLRLPVGWTLVPELKRD
jgi:hypothetical protein